MCVCNFQSAKSVFSLLQQKRKPRFCTLNNLCVCNFQSAKSSFSFLQQKRKPRICTLYILCVCNFQSAKSSFSFLQQKRKPRFCTNICMLFFANLTKYFLLYLCLFYEDKIHVFINISICKINCVKFLAKYWSPI